MQEIQNCSLTLKANPLDYRIPIFLVCLFILVLTVLMGRKNGYTVDANASFHLTQEIVRTGNFFPPVPVKQGYIYSLVYISFYLLGNGLHAWFPSLEAEFLQRKCMCWMNTVITGVTVGLLSLVIRQMGFSRIAQVLVPLVYGFSTLAFAYSRYDYNKCLAALLLLSAFYQYLKLIETQRINNALACGVIMGLLAALRLEFSLVVPVFFYVLILQTIPFRQKLNFAAAMASPFMLGILFVIWYNHTQWSGAWSGGYEASFNWNPLPAMLGFLFSPGKSLFLFNPVLLLLPLVLRKFREHRSDLFLVWLGVIGFPFLLYCFWGNWWGGWGYGPRHLVPLLPLLVIPLAYGIDSGSRDFRLGLILLGLLGLYIQLVGTALDFNDVILTLTKAGVSEPELIWNPVWNPVLQHTLFLTHRPFAFWDYGIIALGK